MSSIDPLPGGPPASPGRTGPQDPPLARLVGHRPRRGAGTAAKDVIGDVQSLVKAEVALAKAELTSGIKAKAIGAGFFIGAAVIGWLAIQAFLVFLGFLFALFLPGWAAVGLVLLLLVIAIGVLAFLGYRKIKVKASLELTKQSVTQSQDAAKAAVAQAQANTLQGVESAKEAVADSAKDVKLLVDRRLGRAPKHVPSPQGPPLPPGAPIPFTATDTAAAANRPSANRPAATRPAATPVPAVPTPSEH